MTPKSGGVQVLSVNLFHASIKPMLHMFHYASDMVIKAPPFPTIFFLLPCEAYMHSTFKAIYFPGNKDLPFCSTDLLPSMIKSGTFKWCRKKTPESRIGNFSSCQGCALSKKMLIEIKQRWSFSHLGKGSSVELLLVMLLTGLLTLPARSNCLSTSVWLSWVEQE